MSDHLFKGSGVAIITPFTSDGIDFDKLGDLIEYQIDNDTDAIVICGTTGEASTMPDEEHKACIKYAVEKTAGRLPVIAGAGSNDTRHAVSLSSYAEDVGADAILSVTPYYNKTSQKGLIEHFTQIAKSISIPVIIYNVPSRTNLNINPETLKVLSEIDNIIGIKECNLAQVGDILNLCGRGFSIYSGNDEQVVPILSMGGVGVISVMANILPQETHDMVIKFLNGDIEGSRLIQLRTLPIIKALFMDVSPIPIKAAMNVLGMNVGKCRLPLIDMSDKNIEVLKAELQNYGFKIS